MAAARLDRTMHAHEVSPFRPRCGHLNGFVCGLFGAGASGEIAMGFTMSTRLGLIVVASLWVGATGVRAAEGDATPSDAAANVGTAIDTSTEAPAATRRHKRHAAKKLAPKAHKAAKAKSDSESDEASDAKPGSKSAAIPPAVANANAQWPTQSAPDTTSNMAARADSVLQQVAPQPEQPAIAAPADPQLAAQVAASDQLNDLDRAAANQPAPAPLTLAKATIDPAIAAQEMAGQQSVSQDNSTWDRTSMIGKVFIALGGVLTMASAVRMFIA
ncbi:MAG: hypothetical protein ABWY18_18785 [Tardiphaga sp.]